MGHPPVSLKVHGSFLMLNIGTLSVQELFFQFMGWLGVRLGDCPVGMVYVMG